MIMKNKTCLTIYSDEEFIDAIKFKLSYSVAQVLTILGLDLSRSNYRGLKKNSKKMNIDISHFTGQGYLKRKKSHNWGKPLSRNLPT